MKCRGTPTGGCGRAGRIGGSAPGKFTKTPLKGFDGMGHSVVVHSLVSMPPDSLCTMAAWFVGEGPHLLRPQLIGLPLRSKGKEWRCAVRKWMVRCARAMTRSSIPLLAVRSAVDAGF
jgi:hypothetical protein